MPPPRLGGLTVLVVDDEELHLRAVGRQLQEWGALVLLAVDGHGARRQAAQRPPDYLIVDIHLEREDGRDVGRAIQAMAPTCRVIACSGDASVLLADLALPAGWEFVPKPSDKCDWCEVLGRMLANGRASC